MTSAPADYDLATPASLAAALRMLAERPGHWTPLAGGTELMVQFGAGRLQQRSLLSIFGLPELTAIAADAATLRIGAGATYTRLRQHPVIAAEFPLLARAASWTGALANQNRGTLGGNIVNGSPAADSPPALLAYDATLELVSTRGTRLVPYAGFHAGYKRSVLAPDELILAIHLPRRFAQHHQYLRKVGARNAQAISKVALAATTLLQKDRIADCRIALASVSHAPLRCLATEALLTGAQPTPALIASARAALAAEIAPLDDIRSTAAYRIAVAQNLLEEFLLQLTQPVPLHAFNTASLHAAIESFLTCCGSPRWAAALAAARPYPSVASLLAAAESRWFALDESDWLAAFACHPRIGETRSAAPTAAYAQHSVSEQSAAQATLAQIQQQLAALNALYEQRFGFRYIVFASGRTAPELLELLRTRLDRTRVEELQEAARQQHRITTLRLNRSLNP